jgi:hypothetical protein
MIPSGFSSISSLSPAEKVDASGVFSNFRQFRLHELVLLRLMLHKRLGEALVK